MDGKEDSQTSLTKLKKSVWGRDSTPGQSSSLLVPEEVQWHPLIRQSSLLPSC